MWNAHLSARHSEQEEEDDAKNEQIQRAVIQGKYRHGRRRGREVGLSDSDSEDESGQVRPHKRQKKENHTIGALSASSPPWQTTALTCIACSEKPSHCRIWQSVRRPGRD